MKISITMLAALVVIASAACSGDSNSGTAPSSSNSQRADPPSTVLSVADAVPAEEWAGFHPGAPVTAKRGKARTFGLLSATPGGALFGTTSPRADVDAGEIHLNQSDLVLAPTAATADETKIPGMPGSQPRQAVYGDSDTRHLVWMETTSTSIDWEPWTILIHDRATGQTRVLAASEGADETPAAPGGTVPFLANGRVYWLAAELTKDTERPARARLYSRDVNARNPVRVEVSDVQAPSANGGQLFYVKSNFIDPKVPDRKVRIYRRDLRSGDDRIVHELTLEEDERFVGLSSHGLDVAWLTRRESERTGGSSSVLHIRRDNARPVDVLGKDVAFGEVVITENLTTWGGGDDGGQWVLPAGTSRVLSLDKAPGLVSVDAAGPHLVWRDGSMWRTAKVDVAK